jgi:hypothetical protein
VEAVPAPAAAQDSGSPYETARAKTKAALTKFEIAKVKKDKVEAKAAEIEAGECIEEETGVITGLKFGESADGIAETLNAMFVDVTKIGGMLEEGRSARLDERLGEKRDALLDKAEIGIATLQKIDPDRAAFFQKEYEKERPPSKSLAEGMKGMLSLFSKKK